MLTEETQRLLAKRAALLEDFVKDVGRAYYDTKRRLADLDESASPGETPDHRPGVLVRRSIGPPDMAYHSARHPCGWVTGYGRDRGNFDEMPASDAEARGLHRCSACLWRADQAA